ncbi:sulfotransferase [Halovulum sp. GXIMD14794]
MPTGSVDDYGQLDFLLLGVARSGTTALATYLNTLDGVICGPEYFSLRHDHSEIISPDNFIGDEFKKAAHGLKIIERSFSSNSQDPYLFGNKIPNYFYNLSKVTSEIRGNKVVACLRDPRDSARSYNKRASNPKDSWFPGRWGFFAAFDFIAMVAALRRVDGIELHVVRYEDLVARPRDVLDEVSTFIGVHKPMRVSEDWFDEISAVTRKRANAPAGSYGDLEEAAFSDSRALELYNLLKRGSFVETLKSDAVGEILEDTFKRVPKLVEKLIVRSESEEVEDYFKRHWSRQARMELWPLIDTNI